MIQNLVVTYVGVGRQNTEGLLPACGLTNLQLALPDKVNLVKLAAGFDNVLLWSESPCVHVDHELIDEALLQPLKEMVEFRNETAKEELYKFGLNFRGQSLIESKLFFDQNVEIVVDLVSKRPTHRLKQERVEVPRLITLFNFGNVEPLFRLLLVHICLE